MITLSYHLDSIMDALRVTLLFVQRALKNRHQENHGEANGCIVEEAMRINLAALR